MKPLINGNKPLSFREVFVRSANAAKRIIVADLCNRSRANLPIYVLDAKARAFRLRMNRSGAPRVLENSTR
jgi:hypothetical protein